MKESDKKKIGEAYLRLHSCNENEGMTNAEAINTLKSLKDYYNDKNEDSYVGFDNEDNEALDMAIKALEHQPSKGHWIKTGDYYTGAYECLDYFECSCCHEESLEEGDYCPNCGAKMEVKE